MIFFNKSIRNEAYSKVIVIIKGLNIHKLICNVGDYISDVLYASYPVCVVVRAARTEIIITYRTK